MFTAVVTDRSTINTILIKLMHVIEWDLQSVLTVEID